MRMTKTLFVAAFFALCVLSAPLVQAASPAHDTLEKSINKVLNIIKQPAYANPAMRGALKQEIEAELRSSFDFGEFSLRTVGPRWKEFSADQQQRFCDAFASLLMRTYVDKIDGYNGEQVTFTGERANSKGDKVEVQTSIAMKNGKKIPVSYRMLSKDGAWRVYDVVVENISLVMNYRSQFQEILSSAKPDELIAKVQAKVDEMAGKGSK